MRNDETFEPIWAQGREDEEHPPLANDLSVDCYGRVTNGPANSDLRRIESPDDFEEVDRGAGIQAADQSFNR